MSWRSHSSFARLIRIPCLSVGQKHGDLFDRPVGNLISVHVLLYLHLVILQGLLISFMKTVGSCRIVNGFETIKGSWNTNGIRALTDAVNLVPDIIPHTESFTLRVILQLVGTLLLLVDLIFQLKDFG